MDAFSRDDGTLYTYQDITCQPDGTWSEQSPDPCVPGACPNPPIPDHSKYKLKIVWNPNFPPLVGESVKYACDAGGKYNKRVDSLAVADYYLECTQPDVFEEPEW